MLAQKERDFQPCVVSLETLVPHDNTNSGYSCREKPLTGLPKCTAGSAGVDIRGDDE